jgi:hypothetical protein
MFIILAQRVRNEIGIIEVIEEDHKTLDWYVGELQNKRYNWGYDFLPHDGEHGDFKTGLSAKKILEKLAERSKLPRTYLSRMELKSPGCRLDRWFLTKTSQRD